MIEAKYLVISVIGEHADESADMIFARKIKDTENIGITFWVINSRNAKPEMVQSLCEYAKNNNEDALAIFIKPSVSGGARPTKTNECSVGFSKDHSNWVAFPEGIGPVTGRIDRGACALVFSQLKLVQDNIDLRHYADFLNQHKPVRIIQGSSTICAVEKDMSGNPDVMKSHNRNVVAIGKLHEPYCVWLKK